MNLKVQTLASGYTRISGDGICNWWQGVWPPVSKEEMDLGFFPEAGDEFRWLLNNRAAIKEG